MSGQKTQATFLAALLATGGCAAPGFTPKEHDEQAVERFMEWANKLARLMTHESELNRLIATPYEGRSPVVEAGLKRKAEECVEERNRQCGVISYMYSRLSEQDRGRVRGLVDDEAQKSDHRSQEKHICQMYAMAYHNINEWLAKQQPEQIRGR